METAIRNIRQLCPQNLKLALPDLITRVQHFGLSQHQFMRGCSNTNEPIMDTDMIAIPTFHGDINLGHWYLAIIYRAQRPMKGYILDSLGHSQERTEYIHNVLAAIELVVDEWTYYPSILQYELECGPRVIFHLCDIIDQLREGVHIEFALGNMSRYHITSTALSEQSRQIMYDAINNRLDSDNLVNFVTSDNDTVPSNRQKPERRINKQSNQTHVPQ